MRINNAGQEELLELDNLAAWLYENMYDTVE